MRRITIIIALSVIALTTSAFGQTLGAVLTPSHETPAPGFKHPT
jgi:hypothetical protein